MKKINLFIAIFMAVFFMVSCNDATDISQVGELDEGAAYQTLADLSSGVNGAYAFYGVDSGGNGSGDELYFNAILTDNVKAGVASNGQGATQYQYVVDITAGSPSFSVWTNRYSTINQINRVLRASTGINFESEAEEADGNHLLGQLYALRALAHLDLFEYYTVDYQDPQSLAVINMDRVPSIDEQLERNTVEETVSFIMNDLITAKDLLDENNADSNNNIYVNDDFVDFLRIKLELITGNYDSTTIDLADDLMAKYPLASTIDYRLLFLDAGDEEVIFKLARGTGDSEVGELFYFNLVDVDDAFIEVSNDLYNELAEVPGDIRFDINVDASSVFNGENDADNILLIGKYPGSAAGPQINDIKVARSSEVLLMKAELEARSNMLGQAAASIQEIRTARVGSVQPLPNYGNLNEALTDILKERRKELCFEGHRLLDIKRIGGELNIGVTRSTVDCTSFEAPCVIPANDYRYTLAIPQEEFFGNGNITQNPSYPN